MHNIYQYIYYEYDVDRNIRSFKLNGACVFHAKNDVENQ